MKRRQETQQSFEGKDDRITRTLTRDDIARLVLAVIQAMENDPGIAEITRFEAIGADAAARSRYWNPIKALIVAHGCKVRGTPAVLESDSIRTVKDVVDTMFNRTVISIRV